MSKKILDKPAALEKIKQLRAEGKKWAEVGKELGVSGARACQILTNYVPKAKSAEQTEGAHEQSI